MPTVGPLLDVGVVAPAVPARRASREAARTPVRRLVQSDLDRYFYPGIIWIMVQTYTAFLGDAVAAEGALADVVMPLKRRIGAANHCEAIIFNDTTGAPFDFNFSGSEEDVQKRLDVFTSQPEESRSGPGRPRLGVTCREVSLLPHHWEWLSAQPAGASAALRRLVDAARRHDSAPPSVRQVQERTYRFLSVVAGNREGFEDALRSLYRKDRKGFSRHMANWPPAIRAHALRLAKPLFSRGASAMKTLRPPSVSVAGAGGHQGR